VFLEECTVDVKCCREHLKKIKITREKLSEKKIYIYRKQLMFSIRVRGKKKHTYGGENASIVRMRTARVYSRTNNTRFFEERGSFFLKFFDARELANIYRIPRI